MLRLCSVGVVVTILLAGGVSSNDSHSDVNARTHEENIGGQFTINVVTAGHNVINCHLKPPHNEIFTYKPDDVNASTDKYQINIIPMMCSATVMNINKNDEGLWKMSFDHENGSDDETVYLIVNVPENDENEDENITLLSLINHYTRKEMSIDISLDKQSFEEECYVLPPNGVLTKTDSFKMENVSVQRKSNFVSCRITLKPMSENLLGDWRLCGKSTETNEMRCQPANIAWNNNNNPDAIWGTTIQSVFAHPVHYGGSVNPGVAGSRYDVVISCHVITPSGEDLVITSDVKYPHIERFDSSIQSLCSINFYDIDESSIGAWTIYGKFRDASNLLKEIHLPLKFFLYNEDRPYEQAYNVTTLPEERYLVLLGRTFDVNVINVGQVEDCQYRMPTGQLFDLKNAIASTGIILKSVDTIPACQITFTSITEDMLGEWQLIGKFSNGNQFNETRQPFHIKKDNVENEDEDENITLLSMINHYTRQEMSIDISLEKQSFEEECYVLPPNGVLTKTDSFKMENVWVQRKSNFVSCRITLKPMSENLLGEWRLCGKSTETHEMRCQPAHIAWNNNNNPNAIWGTTIQSVFAHPVHYGGSVNPGVAGSRYDVVISCHVITPSGEDLVITSDVKYPHIERFDSSIQSLCSINFYDIDESSIGAWTIYGKFRDTSNLLKEIHLPLRFFLYNEDRPYEQAYNVTTLPEERYLVLLGRTLDVNVINVGQVEDCQYRMPTGQSFDLNNAVTLSGVVLESVDTAPACRMTFRPVNEDMLGEWQLIGKFKNGNQFIEIRQPFQIKEGDVESSDSFRNIEVNEGANQTINVIILEPDVTKCHLKPPNDDLLTFVPDDDSASTDKYRINKHGFMCSVTVMNIDKNDEGLWEMSYDHINKNDANIKFVNFTVNSTENVENNDENEDENITLLSMINHYTRKEMSIDISLDKQSFEEECYVLPPNGVLTKTDSFKMENVLVQRKSNFVSCRITLEPMSENLLGDWRLCGKSTETHEMRCQPANIAWNNKNRPDASWYSNTWPLVDYPVHYGGSVNTGVAGNGDVITCHVITPNGEDLVITSDVKYPHIDRFDSSIQSLCNINLYNIDESSIAEWTIYGKFRAVTVGLNEVRQPLRFSVHNPEVPVVDDSRVVENLTEIILDSELGASHRVTITTEAFVENESCHLLTPQGLQYAFIDGFNIPNVGILKGNGIECGVEVNVRSVDMLGEWTLIARATRLNTPIERRRSFTIRIEETSSLGNAITIIEGADLYLSLPSPTDMYDTCKLYGPNDKEITEVDKFHTNSCGYIVRNVTPTQRGTWSIVYGKTIIYRVTVEVNILALADISLEDLVWTEGSAVNVTVGPEDAVYCQLSDNLERTVFDGFGPCRIVIDRVTMDHKGVWRISLGLPGTVRLRYSGFNVKVLSAASKPVVTTGVTSNGTSVMLSCSVPIENEIHACLFRNPRGNILIASHGVGQDGYMGAVIRYESDAESHNCTLRLLSPSPSEHVGIWRCAVNTARDISYGFLTINGSMLDQPSNYYISEPQLKSTLSSFEGAEGDAMTMSCSIDAAIRYCYFRAPNGTVFNVGPSISSAGYKYVGNGLDAGECGIRFNNLWYNDSGSWSCSAGLFDNPHEQNYFFDVSVNKPMYLYHGWQGGSLMLRLSVWDAPKLEYCRFVRIDGLSFTSDYVPYEYNFDSYEMNFGICVLTISSPTSEDMHPWVVSAKVNGTDGELSMTSTMVSPSPHITEKSLFMGILIWTFFGILCLLLMLAAVSLIPKKNRERTYERATRIRNSFRKPPQPIHTDILTDLPRKV